MDASEMAPSAQHLRHGNAYLVGPRDPHVRDLAQLVHPPDRCAREFPAVNTQGNMAAARPTWARQRESVTYQDAGHGGVPRHEPDQLG